MGALLVLPMFLAWGLGIALAVALLRLAVELQNTAKVSRQLLEELLQERQGSS